MQPELSAAELDYYATPGTLTSLPDLTGTSLPADVAGLASVVQGMLIHRGWAPAYRVGLDDARNLEEGLHSAAAMIACVRRLDGQELTVARPPDRRMVSNCRHFATLLCALLRLKGTPARARCGFATYFEPGRYGDHWVCEYWRHDERRWVMVDAQIDALQRALLKLDFDPLDVPSDRFWTAGVAWQRCRRGEADAALFGIAHMWGLWFVRGNVLLDAASLNKIELLPWDVPWGVARTPLEEWGDAEFTLFDRFAELATGVRSLTELRAMYEGDERLRAPRDLLERASAADSSGTGTGGNPLSNQ